jgi:YesN/AraC family two-component response regulator
MPGMNGIQLATELRNRGAASAFLLISGYCEADALQAGMEGLGNCSFLAKPFSMPELLRAVGAILPAPEIRAASVRDQRGRSALRATRSPIDRPAALRRISARLHRIGQSALARADHATRRSSLQSAEMQRQTEWARELQETLERQRAMVKCYFGILGER